MNENVFKKIYKHLAVPFCLLSVILINLDYQRWGGFQNEDIKTYVTLAKAAALLLCIILYAYGYFLVYKHYDGDGKRKFFRMTVLLEVLCIGAFVFTSFF